MLGGISPRHLKPDASGALDPAEVEANIAPDDSHFAITKLVCVENTFNGMVVPQDKLEAVAGVARANGLSIHIDGARLMNAVVRSNASAAETESVPVSDIRSFDFNPIHAVFQLFAEYYDLTIRIGGCFWMFRITLIGE